MDWRSQYNPLRNLDIKRVARLLEAGERGEYADLQWLYRTIEKRDATLRAGKRSLLGALGEKDWEIRTTPVEKLPAGFTEKHAEAQARELREAYDRIDNLRQAIEFLALAEFRGYAHLEKHYAQGGSGDGAVTHLEPVEQWYLCREGITGSWNYNPEAESGKRTGTPIPTEDFLIREVDDPVNEIALICFVRKSLSQKDWDGFIESFGIPSIFGILPPDTPADKVEEYLAAFNKVTGDSRGTLPFGSDIKTVSQGAADAPFAEHLDYQDKQITLAITSSLLTLLTESGSGTLAGHAHTETFERIAIALAGRVSETFQKQFDAPILAERFAGQPALAWFEISAQEEVDVGKFLEQVKTASDAGYQVAADHIEEKTGLSLEKVGSKKAEVRSGAAAPSARRAEPLPNRETPPAETPFLTSHFSPLTSKIRSVLDAEDFETAAADLRTALPALLIEINGSTIFSDALAEDFARAFVEGLAAEPSEPSIP